MVIEAGQKLPDATLMQVGDAGPELVPLAPLLAGQRVILFGLPGAYTGTCSTTHVPGFIRNADALRAKGITHIICVSVNDPFVMKAWANDTGATEAGLMFLADPESKFTESVGLRFDAPAGGLIGRCTRFAAIIDDGVVEVVQFEERRGVCDHTSAETVLALV